jgi:hypothetical protein
MQDFVQSQIEIIKNVSAEAVDAFGKLSCEQLNWKPAPDKWSIGQVLDHIIVSDRTYFEQFDEVAEGRHHNSFYQKMGFISRFWGKQMIKDISPNSNKTFKAPTIFKPTDSNVKDTIVLDFKNHQRQMKGYFERLSGLPISDIVIYSPVTKVLIYSLRDGIELLTVHQLRHLAQAKRVLESPGFPKNIQ